MVASSKASEAGFGTAPTPAPNVVAPFPPSAPFPPVHPPPPYVVPAPSVPFPPPGFTYGHFYDDDKSFYALLGGTNQKFSGRVIPKRIVAYAVLGGVDIDLRGGILQPGGVTQIECYSLMGGVSIHAPPNMQLEVSGTAILGGFGDDRGETNHAAAFAQGVRTVISSAVGVDLFPQPTYPPQPPNSAVLVTGVALLGGASVVAK
ncbi:hypothetical protein HDU93_008258 [Gonapodya sp. JEL0774]|nr:hypothetical protein HDU93_008258 [Gonapodya sp. JEL0774]